MNRFISLAARRLALLSGVGVVLASSLIGQSQVVRQLTDVKSAGSGRSELDDLGAYVYTNSSADDFGTNPWHAFQLVRWDAATGTGSQLTGFGDGIGWTSGSVSVSDDGQWIALLSPADLIGANHDESLELFVMRPDGSELSQVTSDPAPNAGAIVGAAIAGSANKIAFIANTDPVSQNPNHLYQLFIVDRNGTGVRQLTHLTLAENLESFTFSISDDGQRLAFASRAELLPGGNPDGGYEVFAVNADGTGLRQLTASAAGGAPRDSLRPVIAGGGSKIAFESTAPLTGPNALGLSHVFVINWDGTGLLRLSQTPPVSTVANASTPSITDDGEFVVYTHDVKDSALNPDGNREVFKIRSIGTGRSALTSTVAPVANERPVISGSGNRVAYFRDGRRRAMDGAGTNEIALGGPPPPPASLSIPEAVDLTPDGSRIVFERGGQVYRVQSDGTDQFQVTSISGGGVADPSVSADGATIVFSSSADPLGQNATGADQVFAVQADGAGLRQLTHSDSYSERSRTPVIAGNASYVVFQSTSNPTGQNVDYRPELFRIRPDGTGIVQLTNDDDNKFKYPRVDSAGTWVAFQSATNADGLNADGSTEVFRVRTDGTGWQRLTGDPQYDSMTPDISGSGDRIAFASHADFLGTNPDHNAEVFLRDTGTGSTTQLTFTIGADCQKPRISKSGGYVYFTSAAPIFEPDPSGRAGYYRVSVSSGAVERVGALQRGPSTVEPSALYRDDAIATDATGTLGVLGAARGDWVGENPDYDWELYVADMSAPNHIMPTKSAPTFLAWDPEPRGRRYDVIRGNVANLALANGGVSLGAVSCLENDSPDAATEPGHEDPETPFPGEAFFFLQRASQGVNDGPGSYGNGSNGLERTPATGDCAP